MIHRPFEPRMELWPLGRFLEYARNRRKNEGAVDRMCDSIREFGFKIPVLARSRGELVDGHFASSGRPLILHSPRGTQLSGN